MDLNAGYGMEYTLDMLMFIGEVKKYPEVWDIRNESCRDRYKKQLAWTQIAENLIPEFGDMSETEKAEVHKKLYHKWRNVRDTYVRYSKKNIGERYAHAKLLSFLNTAYKFEADCNEQEKPESRVNIRFDSTCQSDDEAPSISSVERETSNKRPRVKNEPIEYVDTQTTAISNTAFYEDEDRSFFNSMLPAVRNFDMDQKLEFRSEVLNLIKRIRKGEPNNNLLNPISSDSF